jgi:hypothetical protein
MLESRGFVGKMAEVSGWVVWGRLGEDIEASYDGSVEPVW